MKMIRSIIRPDKAEAVADALAGIDVPALTKMHVFGRGKAGGLKVGEVVYDELPKVMLLIVVEDNKKEEVIKTISDTCRSGIVGDGKIFITDVDEVHTIRTGEKGLGGVQ